MSAKADACVSRGGPYFGDVANPLLTREFGGEPVESTAAASVTVAEVSAEASPRSVMTKASVTVATFAWLALVVVGAVFGWRNVDSVVRWWWAIFIGLIVLVVAVVLAPRLVRVLGVVYSVGCGAVIGAASKEFETSYDGVVFLAFSATMAVFAVALLLYVTGVIVVTQRFRSTLLVALGGIAMFYLAAGLMSLMGWDVPLVTGAGPGTVVFSLVVIVLLSLGLLLDFDTIDRGIATGAPRGSSWLAAFGLVTSIVWIYVEILRLLAILARRSR
jgi:uncharacterized YccA/Bax inhibitor family protein